MIANNTDTRPSPFFLSFFPLRDLYGCLRLMVTGPVICGFAIGTSVRGGGRSVVPSIHPSTIYLPVIDDDGRLDLLLSGLRA